MYYTLTRFGGIKSTFWNPLDVSDYIALQNDNYTVSVPNTSPDALVDISAGLESMEFSSGKYYWEIIVSQQDLVGAQAVVLGFRNYRDGLYFDTNVWGDRTYYDAIPAGVGGADKQLDMAIWCSFGEGPALTFIDELGDTLTADSTGASGWFTGDRLMFAIDFDGSPRKAWAGKNGTWFNSGDPAAGTNPQWSGFGASADATPFKWRFFVSSGASGRNFFDNPLLIHGAFGNSRFPQQYTAPTGFTALLARTVANQYSGYNLRAAGGNWFHNAPDLNESGWLNQGSLYFTTQGSANSTALTKTTGKYYWEQAVTAIGSGTISTTRCGIRNWQADRTSVTNGDCMWTGAGVISASGAITTDSTGVTAYVLNDRLMFALDLDNGKMWIGIGGTWFNSGDPAAGTNPQFSAIPANRYAFWASITANQSLQWTCYLPGSFAHAAPTGFNAGIPLTVPIP